MSDGDIGPAPAGARKMLLFVSHSRDDRSRAVPIIEALGRHGYDVWWDGLLKVGEVFTETTEHALETADAVLVLWSARSVQSHWVRDEATRGRDRGCMVPVSLDGTEPPLGFRQFQYIDFSSWRGDLADRPFPELVAAIDRIGDGEPARPSFGEDRPGTKAGTVRVSRRQAIGAALVGTAAVGAGAAWYQGLFSPAPKTDSLAVLPFRNLSQDKSQDYFSAGLAEELRATLSLSRQLQVAAQTSSDSFALSTANAEEIARKLGVAWLLEGSVRRAADQLRLTVQLIDGTNGFEKWSQIYERSAKDVLDVQREIATTVADALSFELAGDPDKPGKRIGGTDNAQAFDDYLRGNALYQLSTDEASDRAALAAFERAIAEDPAYAAAHAARARALTSIGSSYAQASELKDFYAKAITAAQTAVRLAPTMAEGQSALGYVIMNAKLSMAAAREPYQASYQLGFGNAPVLTAYAQFAANCGDFEPARTAAARAERLDPLNPSVFRSSAIVAFAARDFTAAQYAVRKSLALNPKGGGLHRLLGDIALLQNDRATAQAEFSAEPSTLSRLRGLAVVGGPGQGEAYLNDLIAQFGDNSLYQQAQVLTQWGQTDEALDALERAYAAGNSGLVLAHTDPLLDPIRQSARFAALLGKLGFA